MSNDEKFEDAAMEHEREQQWEHNQRKGKNVSKKLSDELADGAFLSSHYVDAARALEAELEAVKAERDAWAALAERNAAEAHKAADDAENWRATCGELIDERDAARLATLRWVEYLLQSEAPADVHSMVADAIDAEVSK